MARTALALREAESAAGRLRSELAAGDEAATRSAGSRLAEQADVARRHSDGWGFAALTHLPVVGDDVDAVRRVARSVDVLGADALPPALGVLETVRGGGLRSEDGGIRLDTLASVSGPVTEAHDASTRADRAVAGVRSDRLVGPLSGPVADLQQQVQELDRSLGAAEKAVELLPAMLGAGDRREYLLVVQNNAEIRSTGGLPGSLSVLRAEDGRVELGKQGNASLFGLSADPVARLTPDEVDLYGRNVALDLRDTNLIPDFPRAASLMARFAEQRGQQVDGVVSVDPVTLAEVLRATGPVEAGGVRLDADNAPRLLLNEPYQRLRSNEEQDAYFQEVSRGILDALLSGQGDQLELVRVLSQAAQQRRFLVWSDSDDEQRRIEDTPIAAALPRDEGISPSVGLYLNDSTRAKIQYYLRYDADIRSLGCTAAGRQQVVAEMELRSDVPDDVARLTEFVTGDGTYARKGDDAMNLRLYAPTEGRLQALTVDGEPAGIKVGQDGDRQVSVLPLTLRPGESVRVRALFETRPGQIGDPSLQWTPSMEWGPTRATARNLCG
ncbi:DUF4012 domain-containing protein [Nocardioides aurantiacus]|uniref:Uncharacterized protein DUF4012 n=1 Tax=Nocardioides aurantiacus TaxID=86796 RepID=A0A3N2CZ60_9ACTN|nr:DUF4012 domain-containing protein [Nocardioides aurantiacus]ROR92827.1 uncharacterized protein DUF4012 [Nocardioides aurantiacus]